MSYGKVIVTNDEWPTSDRAFDLAPDTSTYVTNVINWFTTKPSGNFVIDSSSTDAFRTQFENVITNAGHRVSRAYIPGTLQELAAYDGIFLAGIQTNASLLLAYVAAGGCLYISGGMGNPDGDMWNAVLNPLGLSFANQSNNVGGNQTISSNHPIFRGVTQLFQDNGTWISRSSTYSPDIQMIGPSASEGLYAIVQQSGVVVQPVWEDSVIKIEWAVDPNGSFDCNPNAPNLNQDVLGSFPGWFKVTNKVNLPLTNVSIQINVNENARTWDVSLKDHDLNDENDQTVILGNLAPNGSQSAPTNFKWQVCHTGVRFQWDSFNVNFSLTPEYTVSYSPGWGPSATVNAVPHQVG